MRILNAVLLAALAAVPLAAQRDSLGKEARSYVVKTVPLHRLSNTDAVLLLQPYLLDRGGVYTAGLYTRAVTIRGTPGTIAEMEKILAQYDRDPSTITLNFQLIAADYTSKRDPSVAGLDSLLRGVLKFSGYRLLATAVINVSERTSAMQTLSADGQDYKVHFDVIDITVEGGAASIQLKVELQKIGMFNANGSVQRDPILLTTGVTIPVGNTVVLGTSVESARALAPTGFSPQQMQNGTVPSLSPPSQNATGSDRALILTVRPQLSPTTIKRD